MKNKISKRRRAIPLLAVIIVAAGICALWFYKNHLPSQQEPVKPVVTAKAETVKEEPKPTTKEITVTNPIDFDKLKEQNNDIYAYIYIKNAGVDYPVFRHPTDDDYYLTHNADGSSGYPGCLFTQSMNAKDFSDPNTVIYGHNMRNGSMFGGLRQYTDSSFFKKNKYLYVYLPHKVLRYRIFSARNHSDEHLLNTYDFSDEKVFQNYLDGIFDNPSGNLAKSVKVTTDDTILTLSTCNGIDNERFLVSAVLVDTFSCDAGKSVKLRIPIDEKMDLGTAKKDSAN